ncbi:MAG: NAD-dependent epimerase/dehydratase family protein [Candidatus Limnocylindrales bacterium]
MRVLVTGGAGFIGSHLVDRLVQRGDEVTVIDDLSTGAAANLPPEARLVQHDITRRSTARLVASLRPEVVVHCAAQPSVAASMRDPARDARVNIDGGLQVVGGAVRAGARRFVYLTTGGALYGEAPATGASERTPARPVSPYGLSKWTLERYLAILLPGPGRWIALRLANVYGPRQRPDGEAGVVSIFCDRMLRSEPVEIHGDGDQTRDLVYVLDVAEAVMAALDAPPRQRAVNIGTGVEVSVNELFTALAALTGFEGGATHETPRPGDVRHSCLDAGLAQRALGWSAHTPLADGLRATVAWHRRSAGS